MLKLFQPTLVLSLVLSATVASAQPPDVVKEQITLRGTVEAIDRTARTVTIRGDRGNVVTVDIPQSVTPYDQLQVADVVTIAYYDRVSVRLHPAGEPNIDRTDPPVATALSTPGTLPGATVASQRVATVTLTGWDPAARVVTFTGPTGVVYTRRLLDTTDASIMAGIKVGDRVDVTRTEAVRLAVESRTATTVEATEGFPKPLDVLGAVGLGQPVQRQRDSGVDRANDDRPADQLARSTYDDVYGRMGLFKIGAGYRTTPRTEAVWNFVLSRSSADVVQIGTIGAAAVPLYVQFEDYNYWGFEGGQRWFFARTRFTPYVGYLVGVNRYGDIRGTFVDVPLASTPGLAAQDGKFFEKSWALSLGPTGGMLIGIGPFEIMAETQLRFMGGLSDVDWLVEEGLRDINSESSRWSFPVQLGARIRF